MSDRAGTFQSSPSNKRIIYKNGLQIQELSNSNPIVIDAGAKIKIGMHRSVFPQYKFKGKTK
jgi:hypothetical protein